MERPLVRPLVNVAEEAERLREVEALGIALETPDDSLQQLVDRIADIYRVGLCSVNLMLEERQIFKTWAGELPGEMASLHWVERQKSLCSYVVASHIPLVIEDMQGSVEWHNQYFCAEHGVRFYAGVPLVTSRGHALGTLCLADNSPRSLAASELERLQLFARRIAAELQLSGAVERTRSLEAELATTARYSMALAELTFRLAEVIEPGEHAARSALESVAETAGLAWAALAVMGDDRLWAPCIAGSPPPEIQRLLRGSSRLGALHDLADLATGDLPLYLEARATAARLPEVLSSPPVAIVSLGAGGSDGPEILLAARAAKDGLAADEGDAGGWSAQDRRFLEGAARILGASLRHFQRWQDLEAAATTDELTGLRNRRALERLVAQPGELGPSYRIWLGDLHGFKALNDSMGHAVGDLCLRQVADALRGQLRSHDARHLFRLGGDEFALVLPRPEGGFPDLTARLCNAVTRVAEEYPGLGLHLDLGEAAVPDEAPGLPEALHLADARMYEAKRARRAGQ